VFNLHRLLTLSANEGAAWAFSRSWKSIVVRLNDRCWLWIFYAVLGGMKGITILRSLKYVVLIIAYNHSAIFHIFAVNKTTFIPASVFSLLTLNLVLPLLAKLDEIVRELGSVITTAS